MKRVEETPELWDVVVPGKVEERAVPKGYGVGGYKFLGNKKLNPIKINYIVLGLCRVGLKTAASSQERAGISKSTRISTVKKKIKYSEKKGLLRDFEGKFLGYAKIFKLNENFITRIS